MRGPAVLDQAGATRPSVSNDSTAATELFEPDAVEDFVHEAEQGMKGHCHTMATTTSGRMNERK
jgi:hypothetical protein